MTTEALTEPSAEAAAAAKELSPSQKKAQAKFNDELKALGAKLDESCGSKIEIQTDFATFKEADWSSQSLSSRGNEVLNGIVRVSRDADYKPELVKRLTGVRFTFDGQPGSLLDNMKLSDGLLTCTLHKTHNNIAELTFKVVKQALDS
jgi:hypothetical protein